MSGGNIAKRWRQLSGQDRWKGLLDPLDNDLRQYLLHYGDLAQATYDTFILQKFSRFAGNSRFSRKDFFSKVGLAKKNPFPYDTVKFLYATSKIELPGSFILKPEAAQKNAWNAQSNWIGYIAVANDQAKEALGRRDIAIAWRGTIQPIEWAKDFDAPLVPASDVLGVDKKALVHRGFFSVYTSDDPQSQHNKISARQQALEGLKELVNKYKDEEISVTVVGHSLGASLATLNATDIVANGLNRSDSQANKGCPVTAFVYACPRTGNGGFKEVCDSLEDLRILRITNAPDTVPKVPPLLLGYREIGENLPIDSRMSPFLRAGGTALAHDLQVYLHSIAGTQGKSPFHLEGGRDIALVNKQIEGLKGKYQIPSSWWRMANGGMVQQEDGIWKLMDDAAADDD